MVVFIPGPLARERHLKVEIACACSKGIASRHLGTVSFARTSTQLSASRGALSEHDIIPGANSQPKPSLHLTRSLCAKYPLGIQRLPNVVGEY